MTTVFQNEYHPIRIELTDTGETGRGYYSSRKARVAYKVFEADHLKLEGRDLFASPLHDSEGKETCSALLAFLTNNDPESIEEMVKQYGEFFLPFVERWKDELEIWACELDEKP